MKARIAIHSVPRSGSTWLGAIFDSHPNVKYAYQPLFSYAFKNYLNADSTKQNIISFFQKLEESDDAFINQDEAKKAGIVPEFKKMAINAIAYKEVRYHHILENVLRVDSELKVVGLIRNPMATIYSWYKAPKEFRPDLGWKLNDEWRFAPKKNDGKIEEFNGFEKWKEVALLFQKLEQSFPEQCIIVTYDELINDPVSVSKMMIKFCGLELHQQSIEFIAKSKQVQNDHRYSVFKKRKTDDDWQGELPDYIVKQIENELKGTSLETYID